MSHLSGKSCNAFTAVQSYHCCCSPFGSKHAQYAGTTSYVQNPGASDQTGVLRESNFIRFCTRLWDSSRGVRQQQWVPYYVFITAAGVGDCLLQSALQLHFNAFGAVAIILWVSARDFEGGQQQQQQQCVPHSSQSQYRCHLQGTVIKHKSSVDQELTLGQVPSKCRIDCKQVPPIALINRLMYYYCGIICRLF